MPPADWDPQHVVDTAAAECLIGEQFPGLRGLVVAPLAVGWDNTVYRVGTDLVFRFPRREIAIEGVRRELAVLPWLAPRLPLPIPLPTYIGTTNDWPFFGCPLVPGDELVTLAEQHRRPVAAALGRFLRDLHDAAPPGELRAALPLDPMRRGSPAVRAEVTRRRLAQLKGHQLPDVGDLLRRGEALGDPTSTPVLSHGDLHVRHVLVAGGAAAGVIDWGDICLADRSVDLSLAYAGFGGDARRAMLAEYGEVSQETELRARVLGTSLTAALAAYAAAEGDRGLLAECLRGLARCLED